MSYGSPSSPADIEEYYTDIRRGRPPSPEQLADLQRRYGAIGGTSALARRTAEQVRAISGALDADGSGNWVVEPGTKHAEPSIETAVGNLLDAGVEVVVGLVLAPHYSGASVGEYHRRASAALDVAPSPQSPVLYRGIDSWHMLDEAIGFHAREIRSMLASMPQRTRVLFTAHSLPERLLQDDPYPEQLLESAAASIESAGLHPGAGWDLGWQSAGATPEPWRGPDLLATIAELATDPTCDALLVVPHGFTSEHLEVLHDLDIEATHAATEAGLEMQRTRVFNDDPTVMGALASLVEATSGTVITDTANPGVDAGGLRERP